MDYLLFFAAWVLIPLAIIFLITLSIPVGPNTRRVINKTITKILFTPTFKHVPLIALVIVCSFFFLISTTHSVFFKYAQDPVEVTTEVSRCHHLNHLHRAQRNFWLSVCLVMYWSLLYMLLRVSRNVEGKDEEIKALKLQLGQVSATGPVRAATNNDDSRHDKGTKKTD